MSQQFLTSLHCQIQLQTLQPYPQHASSDSEEGVLPIVNPPIGEDVQLVSFDER